MWPKGHEASVLRGVTEGTAVSMVVTSWQWCIHGDEGRVQAQLKVTATDRQRETWGM